MQINKFLTPYNFTDCNNTGRIKYIVIHYVGALGGAEDNCRYYASRYVGASAHLYVGFKGEIWRSVEDEDIAWHCGASSYVHPDCRNSNSIGIELCVRKRSTASMGATDRDWYFEDATVKAGIELTKELMKKYGIPADRVIRHYDVTGKICPNPYVYNATAHTWTEFKARLNAPVSARKKNEDGTYTVVKGDTLMEIAKDFDIKTKNLKKWSDIASDTIYPGQKLYVTNYVGEITGKAPVRENAGKNCRQIQGYPYLKKGDRIDVLGYKRSKAGNIWRKVRIADKHYGWVCDKWIKKVE